MADLSETTLTALGDLTPSDAYREMVTGVGQSVAVRESRLEGMEAVMRQLEQRRDEIGGVDVNEEAAKLLVYEQMFQGVAKFMNTQKDALDMLAQLL
jgi:flagellar hook-associated protein 1 FlgK